MLVKEVVRLSVVLFVALFAAGCARNEAAEAPSAPPAVQVAKVISKPITEFDEFTVVLRGTLRVEYREGSMDVHAGQAVIAHRGEWIRYSTPEAEGAEYIAVCLPAFAPDTVHRDE